VGFCLLEVNVFLWCYLQCQRDRLELANSYINALKRIPNYDQLYFVAGMAELDEEWSHVWLAGHSLTVSEIYRIQINSYRMI
jgi:hypothetical protein